MRSTKVCSRSGFSAARTFNVRSSSRSCILMADRHCPVCGKATREIVDVGEAILPWVIRRDIEVFYVKDDPDFDKVGNIAALLRFRSEQNSNVQAISPASTNQSASQRTAYPGRLRRFASR